MSIPLPTQGLIVKALDQPKPLGTRHLDDVLPLLVPLKDFKRETFELALDSPMLVDLPHT
jgi:hypothetical protein